MLASAAVFTVTLLWALHPHLGHDLGLFDEQEFSPAQSAPVIRASGSGDTWYELYFTIPQDEPEWRGGLDEILSADIEGARATIDVAAYDFDLQSVTDALIQAQRRGVNVRLVIDSDNVGLDQPQDLRAAGISIVEDGRASLMHNKFVVIDGRVTWTGSWNLTDGGTYLNNNHAIRIESREMAANYQAEFEEMFLDGSFGRTSASDTPHPKLQLEGTGVETYFAPEDEVMSQVIQAVSQAQESVRFMAFSFTHKDLCAAMLERSAAGVLVEGIFELRNSSSGYSQFDTLKRAGPTVWQDGNPGLMHHKVIVIDSQTVILGSFNLTAGADRDNDENLLLIRSEEIAGEFLEEFARIVAQAYP